MLYILYVMLLDITARLMCGILQLELFKVELTLNVITVTQM